jgi:hypothetical protein
MDAEAFLKAGTALGSAGATRTATGETVLHSMGRTVVAGRQDMAIANDNGSDMTARAVRARSDDLRDVHEVFVPTGTRIFCFLRHWLDIIP